MSLVTSFHLKYDVAFIYSRYDFKLNRSVTFEITLKSIRPKHTHTHSIKFKIHHLFSMRDKQTQQTQQSQATNVYIFIEISSMLRESYSYSVYKKKTLCRSTANKLISWIGPNYIWWTCFERERVALWSENEKLRGATLSCQRCEKLLEMGSGWGRKKNIHTHKKQLEIRLNSSMCKPFYHFRIVRIISFSPKQSRAERDWESEWERGGQMCDYRDLCQRMKCDCAYLWWYQCGRNGSLWTTNRVWWQLSAQCFISFFNSIQFDVRHFQHANSANHSSRRHRLLARESSLWRYSSFFFLSSIPNIFFTPTHSRRCHRHHCTFCFGFHSIRFFLCSPFFAKFTCVSISGTAV